MLPILLTCFIFLDPIPAIDAAALKKEQETAWADLLHWDDKVVSRALLKLTNRPKETVIFLKGVVSPLKIEKETVKKLIADLASNDEKVWKPAFETFKFQDPRLAYSLKECFDLSKDGPGRQRLVAVLGGVDAEYYYGKTIKLISDRDGNFYFDSNGSLSVPMYKISRLTSDRYGWNKRDWVRSMHAIVLLEHIGTKDAVDHIKLMATGHPEAKPTIEAKEALKRLKAE